MEKVVAALIVPLVVDGESNLSVLEIEIGFVILHA